MTLLNQIQTLLKHRNIADIATELGYKSSKSKKVTQALNELLNASDISSYLDKSYYDFKYDSRTLLKAICKIAAISNADYDFAIKEYEDRKQKLLAMKEPYIFVDTNFRRNNEPIFALAILENTRRIQLDKEIYLEKSEDEIDAYVRNAIKIHYKKNGGKLTLWGDIKVYVYYDVEGRKTVYSTFGEVIEYNSTKECGACVYLKNKHLFGVKLGEKQ